MYIYEYHKEHGIEPKRALVKHFETDTIMVKQQMSFKQISDLLDVPVSQLQQLNPSYKINMVPYYADKPHYLRLPADKIAMFTSNEDKIYAYVNYELNKRERPYGSTQQAVVKTELDDDGETKVVTRTKYYKVKRGDSLGAISNKYGVSVASIKSSNRLKSNMLHPGQNLKIVTSERIAVAPKPKPKATPIEKPEPVVAQVDKKHEPHVYVVQSGDNLSSIAKKHHVTVEQLKQWNDLQDNNLQLDSKLKIAEFTKNNDSEEEAPETEPAYRTQEYVVVKGDNLGSIAKRFNITLDELKDWNQISDNNILVGKKLIISRKEIVSNDDAVADATPANKPSASAKKNVEHYYVRKGDSLFSIAKKYPGVTISDIKKWNGIQGNTLKPGMKLKING